MKDGYGRTSHIQNLGLNLVSEGSNSFQVLVDALIPRLVNSVALETLYQE